jgi:hypothetical protein
MLEKEMELLGEFIGLRLSPYPNFGLHDRQGNTVTQNPEVIKWWICNLKEKSRTENKAT